MVPACCLLPIHLSVNISLLDVQCDVLTDLVSVQHRIRKQQPQPPTPPTYEDQGWAPVRTKDQLLGFATSTPLHSAPPHLETQASWLTFKGT